MNIKANSDSADLTEVTAELLAEHLAMPANTDTSIVEPVLIVEMRARMKDQTATIARLEADNARLRDPLAENPQIVKLAAFLSGVPRQTLEYWAKHGRVKHEWRDGRLWIDVVDAIRQRFLLAPGGLANLGIAPGAIPSDQ